MRVFLVVIFICTAIGLLAGMSAFKLTDGDSYRRRGENFYEGKNYQQALKHYAQAIVMNPNDAAAFSDRAITYYAMGNVDMAKFDLDTAIELAPSESKFYFNRADFYDMQGKPEKAIQDFDFALKLDRHSSRSFCGRGIAREELALKEKATDQKHADLEFAVLDYGHAIEEDPCLAMAYFGRARALRHLGRDERASNDYKLAISLDPSLANAK